MKAPVWREFDTRGLALDGLLPLPAPEPPPAEDLEVTHRWPAELRLGVQSHRRLEEAVCQPGERLRVLLDGEDVTDHTCEVHVAHGWVLRYVYVEGRIMIDHQNKGVLRRRHYGRVQLVRRRKETA